MSKNRTYRFIAALICLLLWGMGSGVQATGVTDSGTCGEGLTWVLTEDGTLTISGTGEMEQYTNVSNPAPWIVHADSIRRLRVEEGVSSLSGHAFYQCENLEEVSLADSIASIGASCFNGCTALKEITLPPLLTELSVQILYNCTALEFVTIGDQVEYIWANAFGWCEALREVRIPDSVRMIGHSAFYYCTGLEQVTLGNRVSSLDLYAFEGCESLTEIVCPDSLRVIGERAFGSCDRLKSVKLNEGLTELSSSIFSWCGALESIEIPTTVKRISDNAFSFCTSLKTVVLPEGLETIGYNAFSCCRSLESMVIPASVRYLGNDVFSGTDALKTLHLLGDAPELGGRLGNDIAADITICADETGSGWDSPDWANQNLIFCSYTSKITQECGQMGTGQITCSHCDLDYSYPTPAGHPYGLWYIARESSETETGLWERKCTVCGKTEQWEIPASPQTPLISQNIQNQNYTGYYSNPIRSYLRDNGDGTLTRIEGREDGVSVEIFDENYRLLTRKLLPMELPRFGGFYEGEDRFFLVFGQTNLEESDDLEVIRVVCYTKDWIRQGYASQLGYDITIPFDAGSLRMVQAGDTLYVLTAREMYRSSDGLNHQSNLLLQVPISEIAGGETCILPNANYDSWFVSHSFNQFLLFDGERVLALDHGDANPRSAVISEIEGIAHRVHSVMKFADSGRFHYNATGACLGGFLQSDSAYLTAGSSILQDGTVEMNGQKNIFLARTTRDPEGNYETRINWITNYEDGTGLYLSTPHLVRISENRFLLLWNEGEQESRILRYVFLDGNGEMTSSIYSQNQTYVLSDCVPVVTGGKVCWYITLNSVPVFFEIPLDSPAEPKIISPETTITLQDDAGGKLEQTTVTGFYGSPLDELPVPERKSAYLFKGWRTSSYDYYTEGMILDRVSDFTLYARWETVEHSHEYELDQRTEADCENPVIEQWVCKHCDSSYTRSYGYPVHLWDEGTVAKSPSCAEEGQTVYRCTRCSAEKTESIPMTAHEYQLSEDRPADCYNPHTLIYTCKNCERSYSTADGSTVHVWDEGIIAEEPTCTQKGLMRYTCTLCRKEKTEKIPSRGHNWQDTSVPATCTEDGYFLRSCPDCGEEVQYDTIYAQGHRWNKGVVTREPTEETEGEKTFTCTVCGETETEVIAKLDHVHRYEPVVTAPTCLDSGYTTYTCPCGDSYTGDETDPLGHDFKNGNCIRCGTADPEYIPFTDVTKGDYFCQSVLWAVDKGITAGTSATTFSPHAPCTRAQVVTFLWRAMGQPEPESAENPFQDVKPGDYFYKAVLWAAEQEITAGSSKGYFRPEVPCTRDQVVTFLWRAMGKPAPEGRDNPFSDIAADVYYFEPVLWAVEQGITSGTSQTTFSPSNSCTRGQVVTFLYRAMK